MLGRQDDGLAVWQGTPRGSPELLTLETLVTGVSYDGVAGAPEILAQLLR